MDALLEALAELPHARASIASVQRPIENSSYILDAEVDLVIANKKVTLLIEVKRAVYPRDIRQILWQLDRARDEYAHSRQHEVVPLVAAESISVGARELLRAENIGFFDAGGSLFVPARGVYLYVDKPVPKTLEKSVRSLFTGKRSQVLHALLIKHTDWFGVTELANLAEVSPATASETLTALERMEWVSARGQGPSKERCLSDATSLLNEWRTQILALRRSVFRQRYYVPGGESSALAERLAELCEAAGVEYALTQEVAAQQYAPFLSSISRVACRMASGKAASEVMARLEARAVSEGANLDIIETNSRSEFLFTEQKDELRLASPVQVYLDLLRADGRSRDMAEHLRKEILGI
ncbi:type IV toxin-antitoxin system AbiEi family antitoxin [Agrobacterium burrii]